MLEPFFCPKKGKKRKQLDLAIFVKNIAIFVLTKTNHLVRPFFDRKIVPEDVAKQYRKGNPIGAGAIFFALKRAKKAQATGFSDI